jgi:TctA family transporter
LPAIALATTVALLVAVTFANPLTSLAACAMLACSYPVYRWLQRSSASAPGHA